MPNRQTIQDMLAEHVKDLYSAEKQLTKAIPKMVKGANNPNLRRAFSDHLRETETHVERLEQVAKLLNISPTGKKCTGMEGCIKEGAEVLEETGDEYVLDLGLIGAGSRVEHYEMAGYLTAIALAQRIGARNVAGLLEESLAEEKHADQQLRVIAAGLLKEAPVDGAAAGKAFV